jgi:hypothetical protein
MHSVAPLEDLKHPEKETLRVDVLSINREEEELARSSVPNDNSALCDASNPLRGDERVSQT